MPTKRIKHLSAVGVVLAVGLAATFGSASAPATGSQLAANSARANSKIAFISEPPFGGYCGVVYVMNADGSGQRRLAKSTESCGQEVGPAWSPDGRRIAIVSTGMPSGTPYAFGESGIYLMNADGSGERKLTRSAGSEHSPAWSPDGQRIAFLSSGIRVVNADGSGLRRLTRKGWGDFVPAWSPDGRRIAFVSRRDGNLEIYVMNADGSGQRRLTRNTVRDSDPVWSPDGRRIAFVSKWQVWVMNADGSGLRRLTRNGTRNVAPAWSPNGQRIAFDRASTFQIDVMNVDGGEARMLAQYGAQPSWSPDGRKIAFEKNSGIYVMNADGSSQRKLTRGSRRASSPVWSPAPKR